MKKPPSIGEIKNWLIKKNPLGLFKKGNFAVKDIDPKPWSGHFNYLIKTRNKNFTLRFKGPEWGRVDGIIEEYKILRAVSRYKVGPKTYYFTKNFFGELMMLEEYLDGKPLSALSAPAQKKFFRQAARLIARINIMRLGRGAWPKQTNLTYKRNAKTWRKRLKIILKNKKTRPWGLKIKKLLPKAEKMLDEFEPQLKRVLRRNGSAFIFESSHIGHCFMTKRGLRFLNWENVSRGDPSYALAVFLASILGRNDFHEIKEAMIKEYLKINPVTEFEKLVDQRLKEREISNLIWVLWVYATRKDTRPVEKTTGVAVRLKRVESFF